MKAGTKVFSGLSVKDNALVIDDKHTPDCGNCLINDPIGALSSMKGIEKYNSNGYGNPIVAIHQLNGHIFSLQGSTLYEREPPPPVPPGWIGIYNVDDLQAMQNDLSASYILMNDVDCSATSSWNGGAGFDPIGTFTGIFDGNGHTVTGLYVNRPSDSTAGLFSTINGAEVKNIGMIDVNITSKDSAGGLLGYNVGIITNCYVTGSVVGYDASGEFGNAGGLVGANNSTITNCYSICSVTASDTGGGLSGGNGGGAVYNDCFWDIQTSGQATSAGGTGKTTAQMKQELTFSNWNFATIWDITEGVTYPWLR